jgi:hypothetical protein
MGQNTHCTPQPRMFRLTLHCNDFKMCGCTLRKNRPWHNICYQMPVIDIETGCASHWTVMNLPSDLAACTLSNPHSRPESVSTASGEMDYEWGANEVSHHLFTLVISGPPLIYQKHIVFEAAVSWKGLLFEVVIKEHIWGNLQTQLFVLLVLMMLCRSGEGGWEGGVRRESKVP